MHGDKDVRLSHDAEHILEKIMFRQNYQSKTRDEVMEFLGFVVDREVKVARREMEKEIAAQMEKKLAMEMEKAK